MFNTSIAKYLPNKVFYILLITFIGINAAITQLAKYIELFGIKNTYPFGLNISMTYICFIMMFVVMFLFVFQLLAKYPVSSAFIIAGSLYNILERLIYGYVLDYMKITWGYINIADLMLWFGLILLNYEVWFSESNEDIVNNYDITTSNNVPKPILTNLSMPTDNKILEDKTEVLDKNQQIEEKIFKNNNKKIGTVTGLIPKKNSNNSDFLIPKLDIEVKKQPKPRIKVN
jgi:hypothetical protein